MEERVGERWLGFTAPTNGSSYIKWSFIMTTTLINTIDAKEQFTDLVNRVAHNNERIILTRRGKEIAVIIPLQDYALLQESRDKHDLHEAIDSLKEARHLGAVRLEELKDEIGF
jgi:prevent-host-death family protein